MFLRIEIEEMQQLGLRGREAMVYSALQYLCKNAPYTGSLSELGSFSLCGNKMTTLRMLLALEEKGLIIRDKSGIKVSQNVTQPSQNVTQPSQNVTQPSKNVTQPSQNVTNLKRKSNQKENIKEKKEVSECDNSAHTHTREDLLKKFIKPTWQEWYAYGKEQGISHLTCLKSFAYYESVGWAKISNWRATLIYWDLKDKTR